MEQWPPQRRRLLHGERGVRGALGRAAAVGHEDLVAFFQGDGPEPRRMSMTWHNVAYDSDAGVGFGEYTFASPSGSAAHGVAVETVIDERIATWREYPSTLSFWDFAGDSLGRRPSIVTRR
jgi:hypothetical protein